MRILALMTHLYNVNPRERKHEDRTNGVRRSLFPTLHPEKLKLQFWSPWESATPTPSLHYSQVRPVSSIPQEQRFPKEPCAFGPHFPSLLSTLSLSAAPGNRLLLLPWSGIRAPPLHALPSALWVVACRVLSHSKAESAAGSLILPRVTNAQGPKGPSAICCAVGWFCW